MEQALQGTLVALSQLHNCLQALSEYQQQHALPHMPSLLAWASYLFCCGNLLAGPYFEYSEHEDFIHLRGVRVASNCIYICLGAGCAAQSLQQ